jgi:methanogenic corrinoid protein MtbC1
VIPEVETHSTMPTLVSPKQAALALGVSEASVKRWCDKGLLLPVRTAGGHRRIAPAEVVRFARESGNPLVRPELVGLPSATTAGPVATERALDEALDALKEGDEERLVALVTHLFGSGRSATDVCERVLAPALHELGTRWEHGDIEVFEERRACEITQAALHELSRLLPALPRTAPRALGGTLAGDPYTLSSAMCALALRELGWRAENLGAGLPAEQLARAVARRRPTLVWVSVSGGLDTAELAKALRVVAEAARRCGASLVLGGRSLPAVAPVGSRRCARLADLALAARQPARQPARKPAARPRRR